MSASLKARIGTQAKLCFMGHALMENRHGLVVDACLTKADGHAERIADLHMIEPRADRPERITLGADKGYDAEDFVNELRAINVAPHVAAKAKGGAIDGRISNGARIGPAPPGGSPRSATPACGPPHQRDRSLITSAGGRRPVARRRGRSALSPSWATGF
jgi:hypothetical protein